MAEQLTLSLLRSTFGPKATLGALSWIRGGNSIPDCVTLELPWRNNQQEVSCVPPGRYQVVIAPSVRFQRLMPRVLDVPGRSGILFHPGNTDKNTEGCILTASAVTGPDAVVDAAAAFEKFFARLSLVLALGFEVWVEIDGEPPTAAA